MEVILGAVAGAANNSIGDKLTILGIFHAINTATFPLTHPHLPLPLEFRATPFDKGQTLRIGIALHDPHGGHILGMNRELELNAQSSQLGPIIPFDINIHHLVFPSAANYRFDISIDEETVGEFSHESVLINAQDEEKAAHRDDSLGHSGLR